MRGNVGKIWECPGAAGSEKAPDAGCTEGWVELLKHVSYANCNAPQGYGDFCLMGNDKPQPHFIFYPLRNVCGWILRRAHHAALSSPRR